MHPQHLALAKRAVTLEQVRDRFTPNPQEQRLTLYVLAGYVAFIIIIFRLDRLKKSLGIVYILLPWIVLHVIIHEFWHAAFGILDGNWISHITIERPSRRFTGVGGVTWQFPVGSKQRFEMLLLAGGYLGSNAVAAGLVFSGFSVLASKIAVFALLPILLLVLWWADSSVNKVVTWTVIFIIASLIPWWPFYHARLLRFYILWMGTVGLVNDLQVMWYTLVIKGMPGSDAWDFGARYGGSATFWGRVWWLLSALFFAVAVLGGIVVASIFFQAAHRSSFSSTNSSSTPRSNKQSKPPGLYPPKNRGMT